MSAVEELIYTFGQQNLEYILPFLLTFTVIFAVLQQIKLFGDNSRRFNVIVALVMATAFVVPSVTNQYQPGNDPVMILNNALPGVAITAVAIIMSLLLVGMFGKRVDIGEGNKASGIFVLFGLGAAATIFAIAAGWFQNIPWWLAPLTYPQNQTMLVSILVFGLVIWFIVRDPTETQGPGESGGSGGDDGFLKAIGELVKNPPNNQ